LIDISPELPLFHYFRAARDGRDTLRFGAVLCMGTIAAIRTLVVAGEGLAVLPEYFVREDLAARRLTRALPKAALERDHFRLVHRADDPRVSAYAAIAATLRRVPLR
jgi:DNA-binding transcriptional LysR family regulator